MKWQGTLYVARFGACGPVKIGYSFRFDIRLPNLRYGSAVPVYVLRTVDGWPPWVENEFHLAFRQDRFGGDWFRYNREMLAYEPKCKTRSALDRFRDSLSGIRRGRRSWIQRKPTRGKSNGKRS